MSDQQNKDPSQNIPTDPNLGDWSPDYFPTSPKSIFKKSMGLVLILVTLCSWVAYCSRPEESSNTNNNVSDTVERPNTDENNDIF